MRFRAEQHLRRQLDFQRLRAEGRRFDCGAFTLWHLARPETEPGVARVGVVASRAAVGDAVRRNRAKRRMREMFRRHQGLTAPGHDLMLVARRAINQLEMVALEQKFADACRKIFPPAPGSSTA
ncbi:MAG: ribonuclease P protein component [Verrucomicrobiota bacterium]